MRVIKAFFIALKQWLRSANIVEVKQPELYKSTQDYVNELAQKADEQKFKSGYRSVSLAREKENYKHLTYQERKALKEKFK